MGAELHDDHARELRDHHKGGRPLRCFLVPPRQGCVVSTCCRIVRSIKRQSSSANNKMRPRLRCVPLFQEQAIDHHWSSEIHSFAPSHVGLCRREDIRAMGHVSRRSTLVSRTKQPASSSSEQCARCGVNVRLQVIAHSFNGAASERSAAPPYTLFFNRHLYPMVGRADSAELRPVASASARQKYTCCSAARAVRWMYIGGLDVPDQPLLPPFVLALEWTTTARYASRRADCALRDFIGRHRRAWSAWCGRDANVLPGVVRYGLGDEPPALAIGGRGV